jgi:hypothetical protein
VKRKSWRDSAVWPNPAGPIESGVAVAGLGNHLAGGLGRFRRLGSGGSGVALRSWSRRGRWAARPGKGIGATATTLATAFTAAIGAATATLTVPLGTGTTGGPLLGYQFLELALLEQLGHGADREAQGGHGGAQAEGLLHGTGGTHLVVAQADAEATGFTVAPITAATLAVAATAAKTSLTTIGAAVAARFLVGFVDPVGHGRTPI